MNTKELITTIDALVKENFGEAYTARKKYQKEDRNTIGCIYNLDDDSNGNIFVWVEHSDEPHISAWQCDNIIDPEAIINFSDAISEYTKEEDTSTVDTSSTTASVIAAAPVQAKKPKDPPRGKRG